MTEPDNPDVKNDAATVHMEKMKANLFLMKITMAATFGGLLFGYDTGVINGALPFMSQPDQLNLNVYTEGIVVSSLLFGAALGSVAGGRLADKIGRRKNILCLAFIFFIAALGCTFTPNANIMILFRFMLGVAVGGASVTVPAYLAEMAPAEKRGRIVTVQDLVVVTGQLLAFVLNAIIGYTIGHDSSAWRYMMVLAAVPAVALWFGMLGMPESPRWLASKGRTEEAFNVLMKVREKDKVQKELDDITTVLAEEAEFKKATYRDLTIPWIRSIVFLGIGLSVVQQITGVNTIMYYGTEILRNAGFSTEAALIGNIANGVISVLAAATGLWLVGKVGRRPMLLCGLAGTTSALLLIGIFSQTMAGSEHLPYIVLSLTVTFLIFQQGAISPVTWLMLSEIFPLRLRGLGIGVAVFWQWGVNFFIGLSFPAMLQNLGLSKTFFVFVVLGIIAIGFVSKYLPETKDRTLEELEHYFHYGKKKSKVIGTGMAK